MNTDQPLSDEEKQKKRNEIKLKNQKRAKFRELLKDAKEHAEWAERELSLKRAAYYAALTGLCANPNYTEESPDHITLRAQEIAESAEVDLSEMEDECDKFHYLFDVWQDSFVPTTELDKELN